MTCNLKNVKIWEEVMLVKSDYIQYTHHGRRVWVHKDLKGKHREHCLCSNCAEFNPGMPETNCPNANLNYAMDILTGMTTPVYECPDFSEKE